MSAHQLTPLGPMLPRGLAGWKMGVERKSAIERSTLQEIIAGPLVDLTGLPGALPFKAFREARKMLSDRSLGAWFVAAHLPTSYIRIEHLSGRQLAVELSGTWEDWRRWHR